MTTTTQPIGNLPSGWDDPMAKTPAEWRELALGQAQARADSWERSDSDGFLSQWAHQQIERRYLNLAALAEDGGTAALPALADVDGNVIEGARYVETQYGWTWVYDGPDGQPVWCRESNHKNPRIAAERNRAKGFQIIWPRVRVVVDRGGYTVAAP